MEKLLVIFPGALGDFVCFLPALRKLAEKGKVDLLARAEYADLVPTTLWVGSRERYEVSRLFAPGAEQDARLKAFFGSYDAIYSWMGSGRPEFVRRLALLSEGRARVFPFRPRPGVHAADYYLSCVGEALPSVLSPSVDLKPDALLWAEELLRPQEASKRVLAIGPGSGASEKNWPGRFFRAVARWWEERRAGRSLVILGPAEEERQEEGEFGSALVVRGLSLARVAALLSRAHLYLGNDSGITHLAASVGVQTVALFGPTDARQWGPRGKAARVLTGGAKCAPCAYEAMKGCSHRKCLTELSPSSVIELLEELSERCEAPSLTRGGTEIRVNSMSLHPLAKEGESDV